MRSDPRLDQENYAGKSINLAMSERGRSALRRLGIEEAMILDHAIPMRARMIHDVDGGQRAIPYGTRPDHCIFSVSRRFLNQSLLNLAQSNANVNIYFHHKLQSIDFESGRSEFLVTSPLEPTSSSSSSSPAGAPVLSSSSSASDETLSPAGNLLARHDEASRTSDGEARSRKIIESRIVIGADGAFSCVRKHLMKSVRMNFSQTFIDHGYMELCIAATSDNEFAMEVNYLHIWPRDEFMMIALPNQDKSFTVTLFMPFASFDEIQTPDQLILFFEHYFPDSIDLIGRQRLVQDFFGTKAASLVSIKCSPIHLQGKALLIGDAAHAMVPFYGQGMNCGFEDCLILDDLMSLFPEDDMEAVFREFDVSRNPDHHVICDLAMYNYIEMRHLVNSPSFLLRQKIDLFLNSILPQSCSWIPLYQMVTFSRMPYRRCLQEKQQQDRLLRRLAIVAAGLITTAAPFLLYNSIKRGFFHS